MEILDNDENKPVSNFNLLGTIGGIAYSIGGVSCLIGLYGSWLSYSSLSTTGAPDANQLSNGIGISIYSQLVSIFTLILGLICQRIAFSQHSFSPAWMWWTMLVSGLLAIFGSIMSFNPINLILGVVILVHVLTWKEAYQ
jgi:magnesium-transporting ATPase (P-type)